MVQLRIIRNYRCYQHLVLLLYYCKIIEKFEKVLGIKSLECFLA